MAEENKVEVAFGATTGGVEAGARQAVDAVKGAVNEIREHFEGLKGTVEGIAGVFALVATALAGGELFKEAITSTVELSERFDELGIKLDISTQEVAVLDIALKSVGSSTETYSGVVTHLNRQLHTNEKGLIAIGVATRDSNGELKNQKEIMDNAISVLMEYKEGTDRNLASMAMFGRSTDEVMRIMKVNDDVMAQAKSTAEAFGLKMSDVAESAEKMHGVMAIVSTAAEAFQMTIGQAIIPNLIEMANTIRDHAQPVMEAFGAGFQFLVDMMSMVADVIKEVIGIVIDIIAAVGGVIKAVFGQSSEPMTGLQFFKNVLAVIEVAVISLKEIIDFSFEIIRVAILLLVDHVKLLASVAYAAFHLDWAGVKSAWSNGIAEIEKMVDDSSERIKNKAIENGKAIQAALLGQSKKAESQEGSGEEQHKGTKSYKGQDIAKDTLMQKLEQQLAAEKVAYEMRNNLREMDKQTEQTFWESKLSLAEVGSKDYLAIQRKASEAQLAGLKKFSKDQQGLWKEDIDFREKLSTDRLAIDEQDAQAQFDRGEITTAQLLAIQLQFETKRRDMQKAFQEERLELLANGPDDPVAMQAAKDKLLEIESAYQLKLQKIHEDQQKDEQKASINFGNSLQSDMATSFNTLLTKWQYLSVTIKSLFQSIYQSFVKNLIADPLAELAIAFVKQTAMWKAFSAWKISMFGVEQASSAIAKKAEASATIPAEAAVAAGGAASAVAGIPIVGPELAAAAYAQTLAMVLGGLSLASSAGGDWQIPGDRLNMVHKNETILPADKSEGLDRLIQSGSSGGTMHVTIHAVDAKSVERLFRENGTALAAAIGNQRRNFNGNLR